MIARVTKSTLELAAADLRDIALASEDGALLGSEDELLAKLGVARNTLKQAARLLEREGLLRVKRGTNGGYYGARPNARTIETVVSGYLDTLDMDVGDVTFISSILWVEAVRRAASLRNGAAQTFAEHFRPRVEAIKPEATFVDINAIEQDYRAAIFELVECRYIKLVFDINTAFGSRRFPVDSMRATPRGHSEFVVAWKKSKLLELSAIEDGDVALAVVAAKNDRDAWNRRVDPHWAANHRQNISVRTQAEATLDKSVGRNDDSAA